MVVNTDALTFPVLAHAVEFKFQGETYVVSNNELLFWLTKSQRNCLALYAGNNGYKAIAAHLGIPEGTVKSNIHRARQKIKAMRSNGETAPEGILYGA